ncbi:MAG: toprim domain-containing protein [Promethearchaeota archaeon]
MSDLQLLLTRFIQYCNELGNDALFIVEGKNDTKALRSLGLMGRIIEKGVLPLNELTDLVFHAPIIVILTDFDRKGKHLRKIIIKEVQHRQKHGKIDNYARQLLYRFCRAYRITEIENLDRFAFNIQD